MSLVKPFSVVLCAITLIFIFCSKNPVTQQTGEINSGEVSFLLLASAESDFKDLADRAEVIITAPDMDTIVGSLEVDELSIRGTISNIPAGFNRKFEVIVFTAEDSVCYYGKTYVDIVANITNKVSLTLYRYSGTGSADINGTIVDSIPTVTNIPPTVEITSPVDGSEFYTGDNILITAVATDADGEISSVTFYNGTELLSTVNESPYTYTIINAEKGSYSFFCVAVDDSGASVFSDTITVTVSDVPNVPPTVEISSPADGAEFKKGDDIKIIATASDNDGEIASVIFYNGTVALDTIIEEPYEYTITNAAEGTYSLFCLAVDDSGASAFSDTITVTVSDVPNILPTVKIESPADGAQFKTGETILVVATASDADGSISNVRFYNGATLLATVNEAPYTYAVVGAEKGSYSFKCVTFDDFGDSAVSEIVNVTVSDNVPPTVEITSPADGAEYNEGDVIEIIATANDADGSISKVDFYNGTALMGTVSAAPYGFAIQNALEGTYSLTCVAFDNSGDSTVSNVVNVTVKAVVNIPPTVEITSPADGAEYNEGDVIEIIATASDADGSISKVDFYNGTTLIGTVSAAPYGFAIQNALEGTYSLTCVAFDNSGDSAVSNVVNVTVKAIVNNPPTVEITSPADGAEFNAGDAIEITADASDADGSISSVVFYNGTEVLGTVTAAPYTYTIDNATEGTYSLTCVAFDNSGDSAVSEVVNVTVKGEPSLLDRYGVPTADPLPSTTGGKNEFKKIVSEGTGAPSISARRVDFQWNLSQKTIWYFGIDTEDGKPEWHVNLTNITHTFGDANPGCTISGSGIAGFDGEYYVTMDGDNMVWVEKSGKYALIFQR